MAGSLSVSSAFRGWNQRFPHLTLPLILLFLSVIWLRFVNLGYSDFQGDEIKALLILPDDQSLMEFLLGQKKGPLQWLITAVYGFWDPLFSNHYLLRLPFAIASGLSVWLFYLLVKLYFTKTVATVAALLMATNGIFVAFARMVQYQSICILFLLLSLLLLSLAIEKQWWRLRGLYLGVVCGGVALLAHFDAGSVVIPSSMLLFWWQKRHGASDSLGSAAKRHLIGAIVLFILSIAWFFVPYSIALGEQQFGYWGSRMFGRPSDSTETFVFYNSTFTLIFYAVLVIAALPALKINRAFLFLFAWIAPAVVFTEVFMASPRTHIYTYLLPLLILAAAGYEYLKGNTTARFQPVRRIISMLMLTAGLFWSFSMSHAFFIDHDPEYPWNQKKVFGKVFEGRNIAGIMAFPYQRNWQEVARLLSGVPNLGDARFVSNEKPGITDFYLRDSIKPFSASERPIPKAIYLIFVEKAQNWQTTIWRRPIRYWRSRYPSITAELNTEDKIFPEIFVLTQDDLVNEGLIRVGNRRRE